MTKYSSVFNIYFYDKASFCECLELIGSTATEPAQFCTVCMNLDSSVMLAKMAIPPRSGSSNLSAGAQLEVVVRDLLR